MGGARLDPGRGHAKTPLPGAGGGFAEKFFEKAIDPWAISATFALPPRKWRADRKRICKNSLTVPKGRVTCPPSQKKGAWRMPAGSRKLKNSVDGETRAARLTSPLKTGARRKAGGSASFWDFKSAITSSTLSRQTDPVRRGVKPPGQAQSECRKQVEFFVPWKRGANERSLKVWFWNFDWRNSERSTDPARRSNADFRGR